MRSKLYIFVLIVLTAISVFLPAAASSATELSIPEIKGKAGLSINVPIMIDTVDNLAGVKIVLQYDKNLLTYKGSGRTKQTSSLMHIVNDKKPGTLVIVMAGARGIKGENFSIFSLTFEVKKGLKQEIKTDFKITEVQLMSDQLKNIKHTVTISPVVLKP